MARECHKAEPTLVEGWIVWDPGLCLRCKRELDDSTEYVCCGIISREAHWDMCLDCWNEIVLMDGQQREVELSAVNPDGVAVTVKAW